MAEEIPKQTTPEQETTAPTGKKKKEKGKSFLETMREIDAKEQQQEEAREAAMQAQLAEQEKREKEAYEKKIQQDRIELIRLKQGVITESDRIAEEHPEKKKMPLGKRISNFFYHNKWWLGITIVLVLLFGYLTS